MPVAEKFPVNALLIISKAYGEDDGSDLDEKELATISSFCRYSPLYVMAVSASVVFDSSRPIIDTWFPKNDIKSRCEYRSAFVCICFSRSIPQLLFLRL